MSMMEAVKHVFGNYATFTGRARRSEYWLFYLFNILLTLGIGLLNMVFIMIGASGSGAMNVSMAISGIASFAVGIYGLAIIIPSLALCCRRLHDIGKPGSYMLFALVPVVGGILLLVWALQDSEPGDNQYGPNPKRSGGGAVGARPTVPIAPPPPVQPGYGNYGSVQVTGPVNRVPSAFMLQGESGALTGRRFPVNGHVMVGRGTECGVRFPGETGGVSRQHCELAANGGNLYIRDLGSTYGTFINGNNRIAPNQVVTLRPGDRIYIGSSSEMLRVIQ